MKIKFLKAGHGDCILIHTPNKNILIDGGSDYIYLEKEMKSISSNNKSIDLLVITHQDNDHIKGIIRLLKDIEKGNYSKKFIKEIVFNSPILLKGQSIIEDNTSNLSYKQAIEVEKLAQKLGISHKLCKENLTKKYDDVTLTFFPPNPEDLNDYLLGHYEKYLSSDYRCDWEQDIKQLEPYIDDEAQDSSLSNKTSIVIKATSSEKNVLLTADIHPKQLESIISSLDEKKFDYIKLPHHGSYRNLTRAILSQIKCNKFIISTNGKKEYLPNKRAIIKILKYSREVIDKGPEIEFLFNYEHPINELNISTYETKKYKFKLTKNNEEYGLSI